MTWTILGYITAFSLGALVGLLATDCRRQRDCEREADDGLKAAQAAYRRGRSDERKKRLDAEERLEAEIDRLNADVADYRAHFRSQVQGMLPE